MAKAKREPLVIDLLPPKGWACYFARQWAAFINQSSSLGGFMASIATCGDCQSRMRQRVESGEPRSRSLGEGSVTTILNASHVALWQHPVRSETPAGIRGTDRQLAFTSWALWAADAAVNALPGLRRSRQ
jgi:hypothetical protein